MCIMWNQDARQNDAIRDPVENPVNAATDKTHCDTWDYMPREAILFRREKGVSLLD